MSVKHPFLTFKFQQPLNKGRRPKSCRIQIAHLFAKNVKAAALQEYELEMVGILDMVDCLLFTSPVVYFFIRP